MLFLNRKTFLFLFCWAMLLRWVHLSRKDILVSIPLMSTGVEFCVDADFRTPVASFVNLLHPVVPRSLQVIWLIPWSASSSAPLGLTCQDPAFYPRQSTPFSVPIAANAIKMRYHSKTKRTKNTAAQTVQVETKIVHNSRVFSAFFHVRQSCYCCVQTAAKPIIDIRVSHNMVGTHRYLWYSWVTDRSCSATFCQMTVRPQNKKSFVRSKLES